jgi:hypothetical protein
MAPEVRTISPADAELLLAFNTHNRSANPNTIKRYAQTMRNGEWTLSNDIICIGADGVLMNGQHRLSAIVESQTEQEFWVWEGCPAEALMAMDMGKRREAADVATLSGVAISKAHAKALRLIGTDWSQRSTITATPGELITLNNEWATYLELAQKGLPTYHKTHALLVAAVAEAWHWCGSEVEKGVKAYDFIGIMIENTPHQDRPVDSKGADYIPCQYHRWVNQLAKGNKRLSAFSHYKIILNGLQAYLNDQNWGSAKQFNVAEAPMCASIFNRF